ncbi:MAG: NADH-quinone oxidoreductase subunit NuoH [Candidatus Thermoplasmatota archaeon]|jgi:NADH-quinone oxidoreductase subunit H|nr:NADH-quinone oxidoreductase subunit NuoH [Candidatus Thermoplasmatota archaeon]MCL5790774.1 NADH-quinone oxidoreductase subunit NuoH [Candidatus Thermoplasmatota archaeon]
MNLLTRIALILGFLGHYPAYILAYIIETLIVLIFAVVVVAGMVYFFRKYMARVQMRIGPNRVGKYGVLQVMADGLKLIQKESIMPQGRDDLPYKVAPLIIFIALIMGFVFIPYGPLAWLGTLTVTHSDVSLVIMFALIAIMPIGELLSGIVSNNKYAVLGSLRGVAKDISFEVPMMLSVLAIVMMASATKGISPLDLNGIVQAQNIPFAILEPLGFFVFLISMAARASYSPFDMGESDSELVTGNTTEYSGLRFGMFYLGLFGTIFLGSMILSTMYLGGYNGPFVDDLGFIWLLIKTMVIVVISLTIWLSMPRVRIDKFVTFGWKYLLPISFINLILTGFLVLGGIS